MTHSPTSDMAKIRKALLVIGSIALAAGASMAFSFGYTMSAAHALILALLSAVAAVMPTLVDYYHKLGRRPTALALTAIACLFVGVEYFSHLGYTVGHRVRDTEETGVQNVKYSDTREQVADHRKNLAMWQAQLAQLKWTGTVSADALRAKLPGLELAIVQESKRGGCGPICLQRTKERDEVQAQIGSAEAATDLSKRIEATQRLIDKSRETAAATVYKSSSIVNQTKFVGQLWTTSLEPGAEAMNWTQIAIAALIALVTTFLAPVCVFMAMADQKPSETAYRVGGSTAVPTVPAQAPPVEQRDASPVTPVTPVTPASGLAPGIHERHTHQMLQPVVVDDRAGLAAIWESLKANPAIAQRFA